MYEIYGITDIGYVRENNEDGFLIQNIYCNNGQYYLKEVHEPWIAAVADGMGGEQAGEIASKIALEELAKLKLPTTDEDLQEHLFRINQKIIEYGEQNLESKGLGTTLTGLICIDDELTLFHIGDSRAYRFRDGFLKLLSQDHSLVESLYQSGKISREDKVIHPQRHILLRCLGGTDTTKISNSNVDVKKIRGKFEAGDVFLLCSDGLTDLVQDEEIESILIESLTLEQKARKLIDKANQIGGNDNITLIAVKRCT